MSSSSSSSKQSNKNWNNKKLEPKSSSSSSSSSCLIILTGLPKSRKSAVAKEIKRRVEAKIVRSTAVVHDDVVVECATTSTTSTLTSTQTQTVVLIDEPSLSLKRNNAYKDARMEKITRQTLQSTVERYLRPQGPPIILDSMNLVKGFRYQLWCIARENACRCITVFCADERELASSRNESDLLNSKVDDEKTASSSSSGAAYNTPIFEDLCNRYEIPDARDRWHQPMFTLKTRLNNNKNDETNEDVCSTFIDGEKIFEAIAQLVVGDGIINAFALDDSELNSRSTEENGNGKNDELTSLEESFARNLAIDGSSRKGLRPTFATATTRLSDTNFRYTIDRAIQSVIDSIAKYNVANPLDSSTPTTYTFDDIHQDEREGGKYVLKPVRCARQPTLVELRRFKRDFLKMSSNLKNKTSSEIAQLFAEAVMRDIL